MRDRLADRIPGITWLAERIRALAHVRHGRLPTGLLALLPIALALDFLDSPLDLLGGPLSMGLAFFLETSFLLGLTGRTSYAFAFAGVDLIPGADLIPFATITLLLELRNAWKAPSAQAPIDVRFRTVSP